MAILKKITSLWSISEGIDKEHLEQYRRLWRHVVLVTIVLSLMPIFILLGVNYHQFNIALRREKSLQLLNTSLTIKQSLEGYLHKRKNALYLCANAHPLTMTDGIVQLSSLFETIKTTFSDLVAIGIYNKMDQLLEQTGKSILPRKWPQSKFNQETDLDISLFQKIISDTDKNFYLPMPVPQHNESYLVALFDMKPFAGLLPTGNKEHDIFLINHQGADEEVQITDALDLRRGEVGF